MRVPWVVDILDAAGLPTAELAGWKGRGLELTRVDAVICHATITGRQVPDLRVANLLRDGRRDLPGPLCQLGLARDGRWWAICDGKGNHNGHGRYGNQTIGVEAFNDGSEPWPAVQLDSYQQGVAAICNHLRLPSTRALAHRESDPTRKTDPAGIDMGAFRQRVERHLSEGDNDDMFDVPDRERLERLEKKLGMVLDAVAGWQQELDGTRSSQKRSLVGRIGDAVKAAR